MKKVFFFFAIFSIFFQCFSQITTTKVAPKGENKEVAPYDSIENFLGVNVYQYLGQELYLKPTWEKLRKYGYEGFIIDYQKNPYDEKNVYKCCSGAYNSIYEALAEKYFTVLDVLRHPKAAESDALYGKKYFLKLEEKETKDVVYYTYDALIKHKFKFVVLAHYEKLKKSEIGKDYIVRGKNWKTNRSMIDIKNGKEISEFEPGAIWKCVDITVEEEDYHLALILENSKGEQIPLITEYKDNSEFVFNSVLAEMYKTLYGIDNWNIILNGNVKLGMTKPMCELSWGKPQKINRTIMEGKNTEQWVYENNFLYFDGEQLIAIQ